MKQTVAIEIADNTVLQLLRVLASMGIIKFTPEIPSQDNPITVNPPKTGDMYLIAYFKRSGHPPFVTFGFEFLDTNGRMGRPEK